MKMEEKDVKKYVGEKVLLILNNNYKFTVVVPEFEGPCFTITDKFGQKATIECSMISMIYQKPKQMGGEE